MINWPVKRTRRVLIWVTLVIISALIGSFVLDAIKVQDRILLDVSLHREPQVDEPYFIAGWSSDYKIYIRNQGLLPLRNFTVEIRVLATIHSSASLVMGDASAYMIANSVMIRCKVLPGRVFGIAWACDLLNPEETLYINLYEWSGISNPISVYIRGIGFEQEWKFPIYNPFNAPGMIPARPY